MVLPNLTGLKKIQSQVEVRRRCNRQQLGLINKSMNLNLNLKVNRLFAQVTESGGLRPSTRPPQVIRNNKFLFKRVTGDKY